MVICNTILYNIVIYFLNLEQYTEVLNTVMVNKYRIYKPKINTPVITHFTLIYHLRDSINNIFWVAPLRGEEIADERVQNMILSHLWNPFMFTLEESTTPQMNYLGSGCQR